MRNDWKYCQFHPSRQHCTHIWLVYSIDMRPIGALTKKGTSGASMVKCFRRKPSELYTYKHQSWHFFATYKSEKLMWNQLQHWNCRVPVGLQWSNALHLIMEPWALMLTFLYYLWRKVENWLEKWTISHLKATLFVHIFWLVYSIDVRPIGALT